MAFTLGELKIKLNNAVGTAETNLLTVEKRVAALNRAIQIILEQYAVPQYVVSTPLSFLSGVAALPTDCLQPLKVVDPNNAFNVFVQTDWDLFDFQTQMTYTIVWDTANDIEILKTFPANYTTLTFWYVKNPPLLVDDTDSPRFNVWWADAIAEKAAEVLLTDSAVFERAEAKKTVSTDLINKAWQRERARITGPENNKLTSIFSQKRSLLNSRSSITIN